MFVRDKWRICRDDIVYILRGPEKGQTGKVLEVIKDTRLPQVIVEGRNLVRCGKTKCRLMLCLIPKTAAKKGMD